MFDEYKIMQLEKKIEQIEREIEILKKGIEDEDIYIGEADKSSTKLYNARSNLLSISEKIFAQISFLKSSEYVKSDINSIVIGSYYEAAEDRIYQTKKSIENKREKHSNDVKKLESMKNDYERELVDLKREMAEEG